jgi:8-oxo-dGTP pyrophosphatase MutT (NUDIX family)
LTPVVQRKVLAYITHAGRLLVFRQPESPEAGIQVPGGTVEAGEDPATAVLREAREETGLEDLAVAAFLGRTVRAFPGPRPNYPSGVVFHRFVYHLRCNGEPPETWRHYERFPSEGDGGPIAFDFFWVALPDEVPELISHQGELLPKLVRVLNSRQEASPRRP